MPKTSWVEEGEHMTHCRRRLSRLIRQHLPILQSRGTQSWLMGNQIGTQEPEMTQDGAVLLKLSWRQVEKFDYEKRACAICHFSGSASLERQLVDFTGEYLSDLNTGAFFDFQWISIGLKS